SEKKRMEEQLRQTQKMETIGLLAGGIAHDFNNLLTVILGYADNLLDNLQTGDSIYNKIKHIQKSAKSAEALTTQLLAFSRRQILKPKVLNLNDIVHKMEVVLKRVIKENVKLKINLDENLDNIKTDPVQLEQIIMNLAINGGDAMPDGGRLIITTKNVFLDEEFTNKLPGSKPGYFVCLSIKDTGIGMDKEVLENIFEPFYTTKELGRGTGLGLATVKEIILAHGGKVWVTSQVGQGSTFYITLPLAA
ncbi:MAG: hybrid sensor histidine kinase/response regulator, partial [Cyclobacteriaceae bacterium]|nr:hybrid sensor histidine kinase/response regulator [Cyclobacteriaceae bacterium]